MREIKFRIIWKGKTYYWGYIPGGFAGLPTTSDGLSLEKAKELNCQYIGLKDKNGKEIYEGDVVEFPKTTHNPLTRIIIKYEMIKDDEWNKIGIGFYIPRLTICICSDCIKTNPGLEIIGNIFENKELLDASLDRK